MKTTTQIGTHPKFSALPGMLIDSPEDGMVRCVNRDEYQGSPVLDDWATQGCLLALLLEARAVENVDISFDGENWSLRADMRGDSFEARDPVLGEVLVKGLFAAWESPLPTPGEDAERPRTVH